MNEGVGARVLKLNECLDCLGHDWGQVWSHRRIGLVRRVRIDIRVKISRDRVVMHLLQQVAQGLVPCRDYN